MQTAHGLIPPGGGDGDGDGGNSGHRFQFLPITVTLNTITVRWEPQSATVTAVLEGGGSDDERRPAPAARVTTASGGLLTFALLRSGVEYTLRLRTRGSDGGDPACAAAAAADAAAAATDEEGASSEGSAENEAGADGGDGEEVAVLQVRTQDGPPMLNEACYPTLVTPAHDDVSWVHHPKLPNFLLSLSGLLRCEALVNKLFLEACFILCSDAEGIAGHFIQIPNPQSRFCLDLRVPRRWDRSRRMRRPAALANLRMTMDRSFRSSLRLAQQGHSEGTWLTPALIDLLSRLHDQGEANPVRHHSFELWEVSEDGASAEVVAVSLGYQIGSTWHDYTHAALKRDERGLGTILTKAVGHLLQQAGVAFWYWGLVGEGTSYMEDYAKYGGRNFPRKEFVPIWNQLKELPLARSPAQILESGGGLVPPLQSEAG
eukprot:Rhum_TRINITY_DN14479_c25_g1::Rhum_TRINITY_DN14479_c25_g1_i1::g.91997::m.91997